MNADTSMPASIVDAQVARLLEVVKDYEQHQCNELLERAHVQSRQIIRHAYRNARLRLHRDIQDSRQKVQQELSAARAKQHTFLMQQKHREDQEFLDKAWDMLAEKLQQRWRDSKQRRLWVQSVIETALNVLPEKRWQVVHPAGWSKAEQNELRKTIINTNGREVTFTIDKDIHAGIRISADAALVDGTLPGLLADRSRIESEILAQRMEYLV